ncbi:DUF389 domain-containing protein [Actinomycetospora sp.]|uniref:DUF389 domain-containing protein n=1 Tax=Actinomycetospora sp. TaxID=1872135 RepID=UPI0039C858FB
MIVAPLMTPILGAALAVVLADRARVIRGIATVLAGAALVVALGFLLGLLVPEPVVAATNAQVASRVSPDLIDLIGAPAPSRVPPAGGDLRGTRKHQRSARSDPASAKASSEPVAHGAGPAVRPVRRGGWSPGRRSPRRRRR